MMDINTATKIDLTPLRCPRCGSTRFTVGQLTWNTQPFDSVTEDWGSGEMFHESTFETGYVCAECEHDCTALALARGVPLFHDYPLERDIALRTGQLEIPLKVRGQHGVHRHAHVTTEPDALVFWRGAPVPAKAGTVRAALCWIPGTRTEQINIVSRVLGMLLEAREQEREREGVKP